MTFAGLFVALVFKTLLDTSRAAPKSYPGGCRAISTRFCDLVGLVFAPLTPLPTPGITNFRHMSHTSLKSVPRGCRGMSCSVFGHGWINVCAFEPPANAEDSNVPLCVGHFFQKLSSTLSLDVLPSF